MSMMKKMSAFLTALGVCAVSLTGCGANTRTALTVNGYEVPAGVYIYYANTAYNNALTKLGEENETLDTSDVKAVEASFLEGKPVLEWVQDKATEMVVDFVATEQKFDELGLALEPEDKTYISSMMDYYWASSQEAMERNGISEASFEKIVTSGYKSDAIFEHYYGVDGENGVTADELYDYYAENHIRAQFVKIDLKDAEGNLLKSDGKAELMDMAKDWQSRVEDAKKDGGTEAVMAEMDTIQIEYDEYVQALADAAAAAAEEESGEEGEEDVNITYDSVPDVNDTVIGTESEEEETTAETATDAETADEETTDAETAEETSAEEETDEDTTDDETSEEEDTTEEETAEASYEDGDAGDEEETSEETADEDAGEEDVTAEEDELIDADELLSTDAAAPYANETIISVIDPDDYDDPEDIYYNPSEDVYNKLLSIKEADYGTPYIVEEDEAYYLVVRYDITERMTEDDLWTESAVTSADYDKYTDAFEDLMDEWTNTMTVNRNNAAYNRYNPFKFDFS